MVCKSFARAEDAQRESVVLQTLRSAGLHVPVLLACGPGWIQMEYLPGLNFSELLDRQEQQGFLAEPWHKLYDWLITCYNRTGLLPEDPNLRNFLWEEREGRVAGLDFEQYAAQDPAHTLCTLTAHLLCSTPAGTRCKWQIYTLLQSHCQAQGLLTPAAFAQETETAVRTLIARRKGDRHADR